MNEKTDSKIINGGGFVMKCSLKIMVANINPVVEAVPLLLISLSLIFHTASIGFLRLGTQNIASLYEYNLKFISMLSGALW